MATRQHLRDTFTAHLDTIRAIIAARIWSEEKRHNALCWAWDRWPIALQQASSAEEAATAAAIYGAGRRQVFGKTPRRGYCDALDHVEQIPDWKVEQHCALERDNRDDTESAARRVRIDQLQPELRPAAKLLAKGLTQRSVAENLGISVRTVRNRIALLRRVVARQLGNVKAAA